MNGFLKYNGSMKSKYVDFFSKKNIGHQLTVLFTVSILLPILIVGSIFSITGRRNIQKDFENLSKTKVSQINTALIMTTINIHQIRNSLVSDTSLINAIQQEDSAEAIDAITNYSYLNNTLINNPSLSDLRLYIPTPSVPDSASLTRIYALGPEERSSEWYDYASRSSDGFFLTEPRVGKGDVVYWELNYYSRITLPKTGDYAVLKATISNDYLRSLIERDQYNIYLSVDDDAVYFSTDRSYAGQPFPLDDLPKDAVQSSTGVERILGHPTVYATTSFHPYQSKCYLHVLVTNDRFYQQLQSISLLALALLVVITTVSFLVIFFYGKYFVRRIRTLRLAMAKVASNDYQIIDSIQGEDELSDTFADLKHLVTDLKEKEAAIYQGKIEEARLANRQQQIELKLLAGQINPHFLYNTLEMIRMKSLTEGNPEVANAIKLLGKCMRYALGNTISTSTSLDVEIDYLQNYLSIMKMRFGERLSYEIRVDEHIDVTDTQILPLLIQPIVENAIIHGLEETGEPGTLIIRIKPMPQDTLQILVCDNGIGMTKEQLQGVRVAMNCPPDPDAKHGIGMYNIHSRIQKYYGDSYGLCIHSKYQSGTIVTALVPFQVKGGEI